jgi:hypothetical protein
MPSSRKLNKDNGLQDWKTEHQTVKHGIVHAGFRGFQRFVARKKGQRKLIGK